MTTKKCCICGSTNEVQGERKYSLCTVCMLTDGLTKAWFDLNRGVVIPIVICTVNSLMSLLMAWNYIDTNSSMSLFNFVLNSSVAYYFCVEFRKILKRKKEAKDEVYVLLLRGPTGDNAELLKRMNIFRNNPIQKPVGLIGPIGATGPRGNPGCVIPYTSQPVNPVVGDCWKDNNGVVWCWDVSKQWIKVTP